MLDKAITKIQKYKQALQSANFILMDIIANHPEVQERIVALNQYQLWEQGVQADNEPTGQYTPFSAQLKEEQGQRTDHITLYDTGAFFESMKVVIGGNYFAVEADTIKQVNDYKDKGLTVDLLDRWPKAIGLTDESIKEIQELVKGLFLEKIREVIAA